MSKKVINIASEFSDEPYGRYPEDGPDNGTKFRDEFIYPFIQDEGSIVEINLDGAEGYGSSFLEEAFGGLVRHYKIRYEELRRKLTFISEDDPSLVDEIWDYIKTEDNNLNIRPKI